MLTRLKISGFKNLTETEIRFGSFTCVAGFNGVGKSNVFDAIQFLSRLADDTFLDAASKTRGGEDLRDLFTAGADGTMSFDCDLIVPKLGIDDYHQPAEASQTYLNYRLALRLVESDRGTPRIELESESLSYIPRGDALAQLAFPHSKAWRDSVVVTSNRRAPFISMEGTGDECRVRLSADKVGGGGTPTDYLARIAPRSILSGAKNADEARTAVLTRSEVRSWRILQLEPSALREADNFQAPSQMDTHGVPVIPVRMTEAWLLHDEGAIRMASGNPNGTIKLTLPSPRRVEALPDPKSVLFSACLTRPSSLAGVVKGSSATCRGCAPESHDYAPLLGAPAFERFLTAVDLALQGA